MSNAQIIYQVTVDTKPLEKQLKILKWRMRFAIWLVKLAGIIGKQKITVSIDTEQVKR